MADGRADRRVPRALGALERLADCDLIVVGSTARWLLGADVDPRDLDVVVPGHPAARHALVAALIEIGARVVGHGEVRVLGHATRVVWDPMWSADTPWGRVDVISRLPDGSDHLSLVDRAIDATLPGGVVVPCVPFLTTPAP